MSFDIPHFNETWNENKNEIQADSTESTPDAGRCGEGAGRQHPSPTPAAPDRAEELARQITEYFLEPDSQTRMKPHIEWVAALLRSHLGESRELAELREHCISEHDCSFCGLPSPPAERTK